MFRAAQLGLRNSVRYASTETGAAANRVAGQVNKGAYDAAGDARAAYGAARGNVKQALGEATGNATSNYGYAQGTAQEALGEAAGNARSAYGSARGGVQETLGEAGGLAQQVKGEAQGAASNFSHQAQDAASSLSHQAQGAASSLSHQAQGAASSLSGQAHGAAASASGQAKGAASSLAGQAKGAAYSAEASVKDAAHQAKQAVTPPSAPVVIGKPTIRRPVGSVRGGMMGFLLGFGIASSYGYYYLLKEYNAASNLMLASVEELQSSTEKITTHLQRLNKLEADLKSLSSGSASKSDYEKNRSEMKRIIDGLHDEILDVKKRVVACSLEKQAGSNVAPIRVCVISFQTNSRPPLLCVFGDASAMKVKIKSWNAVAYWLWDVKDPDDICGICQSNFDGCCATCKEPGDGCPLLFGKCSHEFHLHCIMKWLQDNEGCPSCRRPWEEVEGTTVGAASATAAG